MTAAGSPAITLGHGLRDPQGRRVELDAGRAGASLAELLGGHTGTEAWWSPHAWAGDRRSAAAWEASCAVAVDLDYYAQGAGHSPPPPEVAQRIVESLCGFPGTLAHLTPRGVRVAFVCNVPITDRDLFRRVALGAAAETEAQLRELDLLGEVVAGEVRRPGLVVDRPALTDLARMLWAPKAHVDGASRSAEVVIL